MNDLYYIAYDAKRMYLDTLGMSRDGALSHRKLCDYIWFMDGPPLKTNELLREITGTSESDWMRVKGELMKKGWKESGDYLIHGGAIKSLNESKQKYVENFNRTAKVNGKSYLELSKPDDVTGCVTICVTGHATQVNHNKNQNKNKEEGGNTPPLNEVVEIAEGAVEIPDEKAAVEQAGMRAIPADFAKLAYLDWSGNNGCNSKNVPKPWLGYVESRWRYEAVEWRSGKHRGKQALQAGQKSAGPTKKEVVEAFQQKAGDDDRWQGWAVQFYTQWNQRGWQKDGKPLEWQIELSTQLSKWRKE